MGRTAIVTGASSGIGAATARTLAEAGFDVVLAARRRDRLDALAGQIGGRPVTLDVTDQASVDALAATVPECAVLVNNAGGALGLGPVAAADTDQWRTMYETNVLGVMRVTRALLPALLRAGTDTAPSHVVVVTSVAGHQAYDGGGGYTAAKHGAVALTRTLRLELLGRPVRITEVAPGLVETEFSLVRFGGDAERAAAPYRGMVPLTGDDVAECIRWALTLPPHVNVDRIDVQPRDQATATRVHRGTAESADEH